ncbi:MAG: MBOAT family protein [Butyrivibrio sp.]|nr:MBOAT family protein [Butyrivibrio sp.]
MSFISIKFALFLCVVIALMCMIKDNRKQKILLLISSYVFYSMGDIRFLLLLIAVSGLMYFLGLRIDSDRLNAKKYLVLGVVVDVVVLGIFKYFNFFAESFSNLLGIEYTALNIILPLGISFYIFQSISYIADVYNHKIEVEKQPLNVLLYIGFFPQIVSGPIVKAHDFLPQLKNSHVITWENLSAGGQRFLIGLFKKKVIADRLAVCVDAVYAAPEAYSSFSILMAVISYSLQIYYDFSGYSDMAIGIATMMGFDLGENFNLPYLAKNPSDFWRRWHISLSSWFRDYVYFPLGGSRKGKLKTYTNLFITMLLSGLWHGASWAFVAWGAFHALASVVHKIFSDVRKKKPAKGANDNSIAGFAAVVINYICVALLWVPFRTNDIGKAVDIIRRMFSFKTGIHYIYDYTIVFVIILLVIQVIAILRNKWNNPIKPLDLGKFWNKVVVLCFIILTFVFAYIGDTAFIYAQF